MVPIKMKFLDSHHLIIHGTIFDLWNDPDNADFSFKDTGFAGKGNSGDTAMENRFVNYYVLKF